MRKLFFLSVLIGCSFFSFSQWQAGVFGGITTYRGDLNSKSLFQKQLLKPAIGAVVRYEWNERVNLRAGLTYAKVAGDDKYNQKENLRIRNLNFESSIIELSAMGEFHTFDLSMKRWSPYVFAGLAIYHFDPYTYDTANQKVRLHPLTTEGQGLPQYGKRYALTQVALPFGAGLKFNLTNRMILGAEIGLRKLFTDYLDDVSTNYADAADLLAARGQQAVDLAYRSDELPGGNPTYPEKGAQRGGGQQKDWYYFTGLHLSFRLGAGGFTGNGGKRSKLDCPKVPL
jgi:opacity protein-like surface antigen